MPRRHFGQCWNSQLLFLILSLTFFKMALLVAYLSSYLWQFIKFTNIRSRWGCDHMAYLYFPCTTWTKTAEPTWLAALDSIWMLLHLNETWLIWHILYLCKSIQRMWTCSDLYAFRSWICFLLTELNTCKKISPLLII